MDVTFIWEISGLRGVVLAAMYGSDYSSTCHEMNAEIYWEGVIVQGVYVVKGFCPR